MICDGYGIGHDAYRREVYKDHVIFLLPTADELIEFFAQQKLGGVWRYTSAGYDIQIWTWGADNIAIVAHNTCQQLAQT